MWFVASIPSSSGRFADWGQLGLLDETMAKVASIPSSSGRFADISESAQRDAGLWRHSFDPFFIREVC